MEWPGMSLKKCDPELSHETIIREENSREQEVQLQLFSRRGLGTSEEQGQCDWGTVSKEECGK